MENRIEKVEYLPYVPHKAKVFKFVDGSSITIDYDKHIVLTFENVNYIELWMVEEVNSYLTKPIRVWMEGKLVALTKKNYKKYRELYW